MSCSDGKCVTQFSSDAASPTPYANLACWATGCDEGYACRDSKDCATGMLCDQKVCKASTGRPAYTSDYNTSDYNNDY
ncbi:MAG: hypothetical protein B7Z66_15565 [Chromatiales bacterium 21-64-14]|nr:MAG: hypothetical protein B7Z66_15565 [Chromatiales bacterium 21-64-14]